MTIIWYTCKICFEQKGYKCLYVCAKYMLAVESSGYTYICALKTLQLHNIKKDVKIEIASTTRQLASCVFCRRIL